MHNLGNGSLCLYFPIHPNFLYIAAYEHGCKRNSARHAGEGNLFHAFEDLFSHVKDAAALLLQEEEENSAAISNFWSSETGLKEEDDSFKDLCDINFVDEVAYYRFNEEKITSWLVSQVSTMYLRRHLCFNSSMLLNLTILLLL